MSATTTAVRGIDRVMFMSVGNTGADGQRMAYQTNHDKSSSRDVSRTITKDGPVLAPAEVEVEFSLTTLLAADDDVRTQLEDAYLNGKAVTFMDANLTGAEEDKPRPNIPVRRYTGYITEWNESAGAEDFVEISLSASMDSTGDAGTANLAADHGSVTGFATTTPSTP